jgi:hypothetical protein
VELKLAGIPPGRADACYKAPGRGPSWPGPRAVPRRGLFLFLAKLTPTQAASLMLTRWQGRSVARVLSCHAFVGGGWNLSLGSLSISSSRHKTIVFLRVESIIWYSFILFFNYNLSFYGKFTAIQANH